MILWSVLEFIFQKGLLVCKSNKYTGLVLDIRASDYFVYCCFKYSTHDLLAIAKTIYIKIQ